MVYVNTNEVKIAIIDLYNNEENQGIRCIKDIIQDIDGIYPDTTLRYNQFETRYKSEIPNLDYDIYISSGGPGSPFEGEETEWETNYFKLLESVWNHNQNNERKKYVFFISYSFLLMARYFKFGEVIRRNSKSFGVMPVHKTDDGDEDILLEGLTDPFYVADFRDWQVVQPDSNKFNELNAKLLCLEKIRPHVSYERAMMAVKISNEILGTQFHPEADPASMYYHFKKPERKLHVISKYGEQKYEEMLELLERETALKLTRKTILPNFIRNAVSNLFPGTIYFDYV